LFGNSFKTDAGKVFDDAFASCHLLTEDCEIEKINKYLVFNDKKVVEVFNAENNFRHFIDTKFPNSVIVSNNLHASVVQDF
jgi:hypothetical protein